MITKKPQKRYGKRDIESQARTAAARALGADGVSAQFSKRLPKKSDAAFAADLVARLHGIAVAIESRDLEPMLSGQELSEARDLAQRIATELSRALRSAGVKK